MKKEIFDQDVMSLKETSTYLNIPENVLRNWLEIKYRQIPCHTAGTGRKAEICFFKPEIDDWFRYNGGTYLRNRDAGRRDDNNRSKSQDYRQKN